MTEKNIPDGMVLIPGSECCIGRGKGGRFHSPERKVVIPPFYIDIYPVTNEKYGKVVKEWRFEPGTENHPVTGLSYDEILDYCSLTGKRLPSEPEWEKAARGDQDKRLFPWGDMFSRKKCNCRGMLFLSLKKMTSVNAFPEGKSPYGCLDMAGNIWEWTSTNIEGREFILKGGSCTSPSKRHLTIPSRLVISKRSINMYYGFRCCMDV
jgi:formylglycine-generating enzyme required for sulfatase activity